MFIFHDAGPALLVLHLYENCTKNGLINIGRFGWDLPDSLHDVPVDIKTGSTDLGQDLPSYV